MSKSPWKGTIDRADVQQVGKLIDDLVDRIAELEAALREIRDLPERKVPFPGTNYENDSARGYADALEDVREIIDRVLGEENT